MRAAAVAALTAGLLTALPVVAEPLVRIDGEALEAKELEAYLAHRPRGAEGETAPPGGVALEELINQRLLLKAARERELGDQPGVRRALERARRGILVDALLKRVAAERVTDQRIKSFYQTHFANSDQVSQIRLVQHDFSEQGKARQAKDRLKAGRASEEGQWHFLALAPPALSDALAGTEAGAVVGPIASDGGWTVARVAARRQVDAPALAAVREAIRQRLEYRVIRDYVAELRDSARIEYLNPPSSGD